MTELRIEIPDELALRLRPVQDRLTEIIEFGLREMVPSEHGLYSDVVEFLASGPSPQAIIAFRPWGSVQDRVVELLDKNRSGELTPAELAELDQYEALDYLMTVVTARARQKQIGDKLWTT